MWWMLKIILTTWLKLDSLLNSLFYGGTYHEVEEYCLPGSDALLPVFLPGYTTLHPRRWKSRI